MFQAVAAVFAMSAGVASGRAEDEKVQLDKLPKVAVAAVKVKFPKAELKEAEKEKEAGKTKYEVAIKDGENKIAVDVTEDGTITGYEQGIALKDLPKAVSDAAAKHPKGTAKSAEAVYAAKDGKDTLASYEVVIELDGKRHEVEVLPGGKLKPEEKQ